MTTATLLVTETAGVADRAAPRPFWLPTLLVAMAAGFAVWLATPLLAGTDRVEPWDGRVSTYLAALAIAGGVAGALRPRPLWAHYVGVGLGQFAYRAVFLTIGGLYIVELSLLGFYDLVFLAGAVLGGRLRRQAPAIAAA